MFRCHFGVRRSTPKRVRLCTCRRMLCASSSAQTHQTQVQDRKQPIAGQAPQQPVKDRRQEQTQGRHADPAAPARLLSTAASGMGVPVSSGADRDAAKTTALSPDGGRASAPSSSAHHLAWDDRVRYRSIIASLGLPASPRFTA